MPIEFEVLPFFDWLFPAVGRGYGALAYFLASFTLLSCLGLLAWYVVAAYRMGPAEGFYSVAKVVYKAFSDDLPNFSFRRTLAVTQLTVQESIRKRVLVGFIVFVVLLLFAGLFLDVRSTNPARIYLSFVLTASYFLVMLLSLLLATFSLPNEIKYKTIYTVVTKPIRAGEIVVGKIVGFSMIGTVVLVVMCAISYVFVVRGLSHGHRIRAEDMTATGAGDSLAATGRTSVDAQHHHEVTIDEEGNGRTDIQMGHWHSVTAVKGADGKISYEVGPHEGMLVARVPLYGKLSFLDRQGRPTTKAYSVGQEWSYRSYIEGKTQSTAIWTFQGISPDRFPDGLPLEMSLRIFRTFKGDIESPVLGEMILVNPNDRARVRRSEVITFPAREFVRAEKFIERRVKGIDAKGQIVDADIFDDLTDNGVLQIHIRCGQPAQYFGMAQPDLFLQETERSFAENFVKGHISIWLQMVMVVSMGVMFSTFLSGPVTMLATLVSFTFGYFTEFVQDLFKGVFQGEDPVKKGVRLLFNIEEGEGMEGGGPLESLIRIFRQSNLTADLELGWFGGLIQNIDMFGMLLLRLFLQLFPNFSRFDNSDYVEYGFNVDPNLLATQTVTALAFSLSAALIGYFFLKTRELGA